MTTCLKSFYDNKMIFFYKSCLRKMFWRELLPVLWVLANAICCRASQPRFRGHLKFSELVTFTFFPSIFSSAVLLMNNNPTENFDHHHTGIIIVGLCVRGSSVIQYLSCRFSCSSSLILPTAFHQLTYTHFKQGTGSTVAMSTANTAGNMP